MAVRFENVTNNSVASLNSKRCKNPQLAFKSELESAELEQKPDTFKKQSMSTNKKVAIGIGTLLALVATGFGIKKHLDTKAIKKVTNEAIEALKKGTYKKSHNAGENVQETINNVLGENSGITPHTYDVSKEFPAIHVYRDQGGYQDGIVTPDGIETGINQFTTLLNKATMNSPVNGNVPGVKNKVVRISLSDPKAGVGRPTNYQITFVSPNESYTPLQKDILKLLEHPEKINGEVFDKICQFNNIYDTNRKLLPNWMELHRKYENLDYDLILSAIQSMAKGL